MNESSVPDDPDDAEELVVDQSQVQIPDFDTVHPRFDVDKYMAALKLIHWTSPEDVMLFSTPEQLADMQFEADNCIAVLTDLFELISAPPDNEDDEED